MWKNLQAKSIKSKRNKPWVYSNGFSSKGLWFKS